MTAPLSAADARTLLADAVARIAPEADLAAADPDAPLQDELDLDSMDFLTLVDALAARTGLAIPERDYPSLASIDLAVAYLVERTAGT